MQSIEAHRPESDSPRGLMVWRFGGAWWIHRGGPLDFPVAGPYDSREVAYEVLGRLIDNPFRAIA